MIVRIVSKLDYNLFKEITNCLYKDYIPLLLSTMDIPVPRYYYLFWPGNSECYGVDVLTSCCRRLVSRCFNEPLVVALPLVGWYLIGVELLVDLWLPGYTRKFLRHFYKVSFLYVFFRRYCRCALVWVIFFQKERQT